MVVDQVAAEKALRDAFFVLKCIAHDDEHLHAVAWAIQLYGSGNFQGSAASALAFAKGRPFKQRSQQAIATPKSIAELEAMFKAVRQIRPNPAISSAPSQLPIISAPAVERRVSD